MHALPPSSQFQGTNRACLSTIEGISLMISNATREVFFMQNPCEKWCRRELASQATRRELQGVLDWEPLNLQQEPILKCAQSLWKHIAEGNDIQAIKSEETILIPEAGLSMKECWNTQCPNHCWVREQRHKRENISMGCLMLDRADHMLTFKTLEIGNLWSC